MTISDQELQPRASLTPAWREQTVPETKPRAVHENRSGSWTFADTIYALAVLTAVASVLCCVHLWPESWYPNPDALKALALGYLVGGIVASVLIAGFGRVIRLLEVIAAKKA
jgi:hypothetical protein